MKILYLGDSLDFSMILSSTTLKSGKLTGGTPVSRDGSQRGAEASSPCLGNLNVVSLSCL